MLAQFWHDETAAIISAELVFVLTVCVLAMVVGLGSLSTSIIFELSDLSNAFGVLDQSFTFQGVRHEGHAEVFGAGFLDRADECDCTVPVLTPPTVKVDPGAGGGVGG